MLLNVARASAVTENGLFNFIIVVCKVPLTLRHFLQKLDINQTTTSV